MNKEFVNIINEVRHALGQELTYDRGTLAEYPTEAFS